MLAAWTVATKLILEKKAIIIFVSTSVVIERHVGILTRQTEWSGFRVDNTDLFENHDCIMIVIRSYVHIFEERLPT